jgi:PEP-CTERM motif
MGQGKVNRVVLLLGVVVLLTSAYAEAGVVYTDETAFNSAVSSLGLDTLWAEDFEGIPLGNVSDPLLVGSGLAEVAGGSNPTVMPGAPSGNVWIEDGGSQGGVVIRGSGGSALGVQAISFDFGSSGPQGVSFAANSGIDVSPAFPGGNPDTDTFVGWIGSGSETIASAYFDLPAGVSLDNLDGFGVSNPEPSTLLLFGLGAAGLYLVRRRRSRRID